MTPRPRPHLDTLSAYELASTGAPGQARPRQLAQNESATPPSPAAVAAAQAALAEVRLYPDPSFAGLRAAIAAAEGLDAGRIVCAAGSMELISLLCAIYLAPGDEALYSQYGYLFYRTAIRAVGATPVAAPEPKLVVDVDAMLDAVTDRTRIVFLANPNNPTGTLLTTQEMARLRGDLREDILLVIDAAYAEFVTDAAYEPGAALVDAGANTVMLRTFSKIHGLAGMRVGWGYMPADIVDVVRRVHAASSVSSPAVAAATAAIGDTVHVAAHRERNAASREKFTADANALGLTAYSSQGNFVLVRFPGGADQATAAHAHLMADAIAVRPMAGYGLADCLRITIGNEDDMMAVVESLKAYLA